MRTALFITGELRGFHHCAASWDWLLDQVQEVRYFCPPPAAGETPIENLIPRARGTYWHDPAWGEAARTARPLAGWMFVPSDCERVILCRPNNFFHSQLSLESLVAGCLWTTARFSFGGYSDRFVVASRDDMRQFVEVHNHLAEWPTDADKPWNAPTWLGNVETKLFRWLRRCNIDVQRIPSSFAFHRVETDGTHLDTSEADQGLFTLEETPIIRDVLASEPFAPQSGNEIVFG